MTSLAFSPVRAQLARAGWYAALVAATVAVAYFGSQRAEVFLGASALVVVGAMVAAAHRWPARALAAAPLLVLVAGTKFRVREADASLSNQLDGQIAFELALFGTLALVLLAVLASGTVRARRPSLTERALQAFLVLAAVSTLWSGAPTLTLVRSGQLALLFALATAMVRVLGPAPALRALGASVAGLVLVFSLVGALLPGTRHYDVRFSWFSVHPITCATLAALALLFATASATSGAGRMGRRVLGFPAWVLAVPLVVVILLTRSRGPLLGLFAGLAVLVVWRYLRTWQVQMLAAAALVGAIVYLNSSTTLPELLAAGATSGNPLVEFLYRGQSAEEVLSFTGRTELWAAARELVAESPVVGYGYQGSRGLLLERYSWAGYAHNAFLQTVLDTGVLGTLLLWGAVAGGMVAALRRREGAEPEQRPFAAAALVFLVVNSGTSESFAAAPGYEALLLFTLLFAFTGWGAEERAAAVPVRAAPRAFAPGGVRRLRAEKVDHVGR